MSILTRSPLRRSPLQRKTTLGQAAPVLKSTTPRPRKCAVCAETFKPQRMGQKVCGVDCSIAQGQKATARQAAQQERERKAAARAERQEAKRKLEQMKPLEYWLKKAETACNEYIRARDPDICISCGVTHSSAWQAGHYVSVGANRTLRYHEDNIHKQCIQCNMFKGSNATEYRKRLLEKIGLERVEWLESWHSPVKMTREAAQEIETYYRAKLRILKEKA